MPHFDIRAAYLQGSIKSAGNMAAEIFFRQRDKIYFSKNVELEANSQVHIFGIRLPATTTKKDENVEHKKRITTTA